MDADQIIEAFSLWRQRHARSAWKPRTAGGGGGNALSRFGGNPSSDPGPWPTCRQCKAPMRLLLQLDLESLPAEFQAPLREGLLQLFYCSTDDGSCETWLPFSGAQEIRIVPRAGSAPASVPVAPLEAAAIEGWDRFEDSPHPEEHGPLGVHYDYDFKGSRVHVSCDDPPLALRDLDLSLDVAELVAMASPGDKLGGWPHWVQGVEYPNCKQCGAVMSLFMQIDSNDHLKYTFGDAGCAHLTYCRNHPGVMAFGWACG